MAITTRFTELIGCAHPLQQAGMGGVATAELAIAVSNAGALGMLSGIGGANDLAAQLDGVPGDACVGVNFLVPFLDRDAVELAAERTRYVEFFWGEPSAALVELAHGHDALAGWQVGSVDEARAADAAGCDLVVAQGIEAGGHVRGTIGVLALLDEVCEAVDLPVIAAGGIGSGASMAAALVAGADAVRVGTRFVTATETNAHPLYVDALVEASANDTVLTTAFGWGWPDAPHRVLKSAVDAGVARGEEQQWTPDWPTADFTGAVQAKALYAGQSVGAVRERQSAAAIVAELTREAERILTGE